MCRKSEVVDAIILEKRQVTEFRDSLSELLKYLKNEVTVLELSQKRCYTNLFKDKIENYRNIIELISLSIAATYDISKTESKPTDINIFSETANRLIEHIRMIKKLLNEKARDVLHRFTEIIKACDGIINSTTRLKTLLTA